MVNRNKSRYKNAYNVYKEKISFIEFSKLYLENVITNNFEELIDKNF